MEIFRYSEIYIYEDLRTTTEMYGLMTEPKMLLIQVLTLTDFLLKLCYQCLVAISLFDLEGINFKLFAIII